MNVQKIVTDSGVSLLQNVVSVGGSLLLVPIITKLMGTETYGIWVLILSLVALFAGVGELHLHGALVRYSPRESMDGQTFVDTLVLASLAATGTILVFAISVFWFDLQRFIGIEPATSGLLTASALLIGLRVLFMLLRNFPRSEGKIKTFEAIRTMEVVLKNALLIAVLLRTRSIEAGLWTLVGVYTAMDAGLLLSYLPGRLRRPDVGKFREYLSYSVPMVPKELANQLLRQSDKFLIVYFISPSATAIYAISYGVASIFPNFTGIMNPTLYPMVSEAWDEGDTQSIQEFYTGLAKVYVLLGAPAFVGLTLLAWPILRILSTVEVANKGWVLVPLLSVAFLTNGFENPIVYVLNAAEQTRKVAIGNGIAVTLNIALNLVLIPTIGLPGAAVAMIFALVAEFVYIYIKVTQYVSIPIPVSTAVKACVGSALMASVLRFGLPVVDAPRMEVLLYPIVGSTIYFLFMIATGEIKPSGTV